jgi:hypothetical protein
MFPLFLSKGIMPKTGTFKPGEVVLTTGAYRVHHASHRLMHEGTLLLGDRFPRCRQCGDDVRFELIRVMRDADVLPFRSGEILTEYEQARKFRAG